VVHGIKRQLDPDEVPSWSKILNRYFLMVCSYHALGPALFSIYSAACR